MALKTKESINAFQIFLKDYNTLIENYTIDEVKELAQMYEETSQPNNFDKYLTSKEKENYYKEKQKEYYKDSILTRLMTIAAVSFARSLITIMEMAAFSSSFDLSYIIPKITIPGVKFSNL